MDALKYVSQILDDADSWETMMFLYDAALRQMSTKIDILNEEFIHIHNYNPIEHVKSRIKEPKSIAGIRIICSFTQDIYRIADMLAKQSDLRVVELTDYLTHPKVSGYRSYHMLVAVPVHLSDRVVDITVEVQIRTIAQDFWASLEHKIYYKFEGSAPEYISRDLRACAEFVAELDEKMLSLNEAIQKEAIQKSEEAEEKKEE